MRRAAKARPPLTVELSWPDRALSPNSRANWRVKWRAQQWAKLEARMLLRKAANVKGFEVADLYIGETIPLRYVFRPPNKRRRDLDNFVASMKAAQDGLAEALGVDDSVFDLGKPEWGAPLEHGGVFVVIGEA